MQYDSRVPACGPRAAYAGVCGARSGPLFAAYGSFFFRGHATVMGAAARSLRRAAICPLLKGSPASGGTLPPLPKKSKTENRGVAVTTRLSSLFKLVVPEVPFRLMCL